MARGICIVGIDMLIVAIRLDCAVRVGCVLALAFQLDSRRATRQEEAERRQNLRRVRSVQHRHPISAVWSVGVGLRWFVASSLTPEHPPRSGNRSRATNS
jgi:hypothetical protein